MADALDTLLNKTLPNFLGQEISNLRTEARFQAQEERDQKKREDIIRTYIFDVDQNYIIVLDPQRSKRDYYLVTAYFLNKNYGAKKIKKLLKRRLPEVH